MFKLVRTKVGISKGKSVLVRAIKATGGEWIYRFLVVLYVVVIYM